MNCLLIAATYNEISSFIESYRDSSEPWTENIELDILITGVGLTGTTYLLTKQLQLKRPDLVIQAGIAGCFDKEIELGSVVIVRDERIADEAVLEDGKLVTLKDLGLRDPDQPPYKNGWLKNSRNQLLKKTELPLVKGISVNQLTTDKKTRKQYHEVFKPVTESMEGAALHLVCLSEKVPFLQVRAISNYAGERDKKKWKMKRSLRALNNELKNLLIKLNTSDKKSKS